MSRHRNVRSMNYEDEYFDEDDVYGHSVEDNYCVSPGTAAQFTFNRDRNVALSSFMDEQGGIPEEDEGDDTDEGTPREHHRGSLDYTRPKLTDVDEAKLNSVLEEVRNVLGEAVPEGIMVDTILRRNFSVEGTLNELLTQQEAPKPQREPRRDRRNRSQELDDEIDINNDGYFLPDNVFSDIPETTGGVMKFGESVSPKPSSLLLKSEDLSLGNAKMADLNDFYGQVVDDSTVVVKDGQFNTHKSQISRDKLSEVKSKKGKFTNDTQSSSVAKDQITGTESKPGSDESVRESESKSTTDIKKSLSALAKQHRIANTGRNHEVTEVLEPVVRNVDTGVSVQTGQAFSLGNSQTVTQLVFGNQQENMDVGNCMPLMKAGKPVSLSGLANKSRGGVVSEGKIAQTAEKTSGLSLADLAKSHRNTQMDSLETQTKPQLTLSNLAEKHCDKTGLAAKNFLSEPRSDQSEHHFTSAIGTDAGSEKGAASVNSTASKSLTNLAALHLNGSKESGSISADTSSSPLASLASQHLCSAQSPSSKIPNSGPGFKTFSSLSSPCSSSAPLSMASSPLSGLSKSSSAVSPGKSTIGLSLSQLAEAHGVKTSPLSRSGKESSNGLSNSSSGGSAGKSPVGLSLSQLAQAHGVRKSPLSDVGKEGRDTTEGKEKDIGKPKSGTLLSCELFKNKTDKEQIMLSLSNLVEKHGKNDDKVIITRHSATSHSLNIDKHRDSSLEKGKVNNNVNGDISKAATISLADLAKVRNPNVLTDMKSKGNIDAKNVKPVSEAVHDDEETAKETNAMIDRTRDDLNLDSENVLEEKLKLADGPLFEAVKHQVQGPSGVGNTICMEIRVRKERKYKIKKFSYKSQIKGVKEKLQVEARQIEPFDFSTPSPDDIVKAKQKQAFNRSGK